MYGNNIQAVFWPFLFTLHNGSHLPSPFVLHRQIAFHLCLVFARVNLLKLFFSVSLISKAQSLLEKKQAHKKHWFSMGSSVCTCFLEKVQSTKYLYKVQRETELICRRTMAPRRPGLCTLSNLVVSIITAEAGKGLKESRQYWLLKYCPGMPASLPKWQPAFVATN